MVRSPVESVEIAVVVPAYREEDHLPGVLAGMPEFVDRVIVVDDASPDHTYEVASRAARRDARIDICRRGFNEGVGRAIARGYERSLELGADVTAVMAGDGQMDPDDLESVVAPVAAGRADYAKGNRLAHSDRREMPLLRRIGSQLLARVTGWIGGYEDLDDSQCGYTAIRTSLLDHLSLRTLYPEYGYPNDLLLRLGRVGADIVEPTVRPVYDDEGSDLSIRAVALPIAAILLDGWLRQ